MAMMDNSSLTNRSSHHRARTAVATPMALLILIMAIALSACNPTQQSAARTAIPNELVGVWNGGPDPYKYQLTLTSDGRYELSNSKYGYWDTGVVALQLETMTFTSEVTGKKQVRQWAFQTSPNVFGYTFSNLSLDGYSYVRES